MLLLRGCMNFPFEYNYKTGFITVSVSVAYVGEHCLTNNNGYVWIYYISIKNDSDHTIKLLNRYWEIIDNKGIVSKISGSGVTGFQPLIKALEIFEYSSGTYLNTQSGIMQGYYEFSDENDKKILQVKIPPFSLDIPDNVNLIN